MDTTPAPRSRADSRQSAPDHPPKADADQFLREMLADGPMRQVDVTQAAAAQRIADRTLRRARVRLGVVATKHGFGSGSFWVWRLRPSTHREIGAQRADGHDGKNRIARRRRTDNARQSDHTPDV
ncbi:MAG: hypothetical protein O2930_10460 [Acidobacteria bacterium]|nr:hypothetical protein [Acidobacteriota bacterium]